MKTKYFLFSEFWIGSGSAIASSTISFLNPSVGIVITSSTALIIFMAILITNEYISELKIRHTKLRDWINAISLLYDKTVKQSMRDRKN